MLTETISGKCPCCNYDKLLQRYGSMGYYQLDGCPNCGFGYGSNGYPESDDNKVGIDAWIDYGIYIVSMFDADSYIDLFQDDDCIVRKDNSIINNGGQTKESKAVDYAYKVLQELTIEEKRKRIFECIEKQTRCDDVKETIFQYNEEDIKNYLNTKPTIFKCNFV